MMHNGSLNLFEDKLMDCLNRSGYDLEIELWAAPEPIEDLALATA